MRKIWGKAVATFLLCTVLFVTQMSVSAAPVETAVPCLGIDVSRFQKQIDWNTLSQTGISFVMVRIGSRTTTTGILQEDEYARYNLQEANKYGVKAGAYFYSTAITPEEAVEEANFVADILDKYQITYPVAYDCEKYNNKTSRQYPFDKAYRTAIACIFMDTIAARGYTPMFYGNRSSMTNSKDWDMNIISSKYKVWVAYYPKEPFPITENSGYVGAHAMWQYSDKMTFPGIGTNVDINLAYFNYSEVAAAKDPAGAPAVLTPSNAQYTAVQEIVTPTSRVNVRTAPNSADPNNILTKLEPGIPVWRIGLGNNGWSQVIIGDAVYYISSSYLKRV